MIFVNRGYNRLHDGSFPREDVSAYVPGADGDLLPPRSGPLMEEVWSGCATAIHSAEHLAAVYQAHAVAGRDGPNKGKMGDPIFDYFCQDPTRSPPTGKDMEELSAKDIVELVDLIHETGDPVCSILACRLQVWLVRRRPGPKLVQRNYRGRKPVAATDRKTREEGRPVRGGCGALTNSPITYDPPVKSAS